MDNFSKTEMPIKRLFEIASGHDATLKQVLERLDKQEYAIKKYWTIKTDFISNHTDLIERQEKILNRDKVTLNKIILD